MTRLHDPDSPDPPVGEFSTSELGALLREARIALGRELEDVAAELRIRLVYLQAIEQGRLDDLPGIAYATGFLRAYADFLDLDGNDLVRRFKAAGMAMSRATDLHLPSPVEEGRLPTGSVLLVAALLAFGAYGGWYYMSSQGRDPIVNVAALPDRLAELVGIDSEKPQVADAEDAAPSDAAPMADTVADAVADTVADTVAGGLETTDTTPNAVASMTDGASDAAPPGAGQGGAPMASAESTTTAENAAPPSPQAAPVRAARIDLPPASPVATGEASATTTDEAATTPAETTPAVARAVLPEPPAAPKRKPAAEARAAAPPTTTTAETIAATTTATTTAATTAPEVPVAPVASVDAPSASTIVAAATSGEPSATDAAVPGAAPATTPTAAHRVVLRANIDTWVEVAAAEQTPVLSRLMREGETFVVPTQPGLMMATGNAGGIEILVDGKAIPRLGSIGEVRKNVALDAESLLNTATATR